MSKIKKIRNYHKLHGTKQTINWLANNVKYRVQKTRSKPIEFDYLKEENDDLILKTKGHIFIFGSVPYYDIGGGQRSAQLAKIFNKLGYEVFYVFAFDSSECKKFNLEIPCVMHKYINNLKTEEMAKYMGEKDIVIFEAPCSSFAPYIKLAQAKKTKIVYENIDNWESNLGNSVFDADTLKLLIENADLLTATAKPLLEQLKMYTNRFEVNKKIIYAPNAVDDELFNPHKEYTEPTDLVKGSQTLLYYGSLWGDWFDWELIYDLANNNPEITINLIGDDSSVDKKEKPKNVYFLGIKKQSELPAYLKYSDYAILPFKADNIGRYVSPLKIFEYIAMEKKVLATELPDIIGYPNLEIGNTYKEWEKVLKKKSKEDIKKAQEFISENNWYQRCIDIIEGLSSKGVKKCPSKYYENISVVILNHNNEKVIFRCVDSLIKYNKRYNYEIIVVDNQSSDGSYEKLKKEYKGQKEVKIIQNSKNGCASGRNLGYKEATKDYIVFLDSDQWVLHEYWLDNYLDVYSQAKNVGAIAWGAGWFNDYGFAYRTVDNYDYRSMPANVLARSDIGYLATCGFMIKKDLLEKIDGLDEAYDPTCYEDTDLALKVRNSGKEIYYSNLLGVGHIPHQSFETKREDYEKLVKEKAEYFIKKWKEENPKLLEYKK